MDSVKNLVPVRCCVNCANWDEGHGEWKSTCILDTDDEVFSPAHICDSYRVKDNYWKDIV